MSFLYLLQSAWSFSDLFDARDATIDSVHNAVFARGITCREIVSSFLARIEELNPIINAIISLNPNALADADDLDDWVASGNLNATGTPLFCVPVLLKDNFDAAGMNTTAGCLALAGNRALADAPTVEVLKEAGAVILGKTNLHEMALEGLTASSFGGQTVNPYDLIRTPGGSSGGSGAAVAAGFAVLATGTDTVNSLRNPASANALFSIRPTRGLISRRGVVPVGSTQDAVGVMARDVRDLAVGLSVMAIVPGDDDVRENVRAGALLAHPGAVRHRDYTTFLTGGCSLKGVRFGLVKGFFNHSSKVPPDSETTPVNDIMSRMVSTLTAAGAVVVNITEPVYDALAIAATLDVQAFEFREALNAYLAEHRTDNETHETPGSFETLYSRRNTTDFLVIPAQSEFIRRAWHSSTSDPAYATRLSGIRNLTQTLAATFATHNLDALIYPQQKNLVVKVGAPSQHGRNGILAALTGYPSLCMPAGFSPPSADAPRGVPVGMEILGRPWSERLLLSIASRIAELGVRRRRMPAFADRFVEPKCYDAVPVITPNSGNLPGEYPLGIF
jgi:Asp-tRNA(Asn)/Glu-tRNA(Gln) amidotransferase A subunit family amidase